MMNERPVAGWDLGGAHLKVAVAAGERRIVQVVQVPCPLWQGLEHLSRAVDSVRGRLGGAACHGVTMTGELVDLFDNRAEGVARLIEAMAQAFPGDRLLIYGGAAGFLAPEAAAGRPVDIASANWHAGVRFAAGHLAQGLFVDIGSTTSDIVPFRDGAVRAAGAGDGERLAAEELVYTGATRTPVMAVAEEVPFQGARQGLMAEVFATMADVHRLTGGLPEDADQLPAADGRDKSVLASSRRLARMLGRDLESAAPDAWARVAGYLAERQLQRLWQACQRVLSRDLLDHDAPLVAAGVGRFLAPELARRLGRPMIDFGQLVEGPPEAVEGAARSAPATAVALLAAGSVASHSE
jgi:probable H4MPT-linked C1 transfer pathway protein